MKNILETDALQILSTEISSQPSPVCIERSYYFDDAALVNINVGNQRIIHIIT